MIRISHHIPFLFVFFSFRNAGSFIFEKIRNEKADSFIYTYKSVEVGYEQRRTDGSVL